MKATGIEVDPEILISCNSEENNDDKNKDNNDNDDSKIIDKNDDHVYEYPFVHAEYYDSEGDEDININKTNNENNENENNENNKSDIDKACKKTNIYLLSQSIGFSVKNKFISRKDLSDLMKIKKKN